MRRARPVARSRGVRGWIACASVAVLLAGCEPGDVVPSGSTGTPTSPPSPVRPKEVVFAVKGDWGAGTSAQRAITERMCRVRLLVPFRVVVTTGDNFYGPDGTATARTYTDPERCLLEEPRHRWRAAWGNHDVAGDATAEVLGADPASYRFRLPGVDVFVLDSNRAHDPALAARLEGWLAAARAPVRVVAFHHPPFTAGNQHPPDERVRERWVPLFERYDVTLVLNGHQHLYEHHRSAGVDYVVSGGGGAVLYACARRPASLIRCEEHHHFLLVRVIATTVTVEAIAANGDTIDRFRVDA